MRSNESCEENFERGYRPVFECSLQLTLQTPTSNIQLKNFEFINSSKANLAKNLVNSNADLNSKPEAQGQDNKINNLISNNNNNNNNNNMRVYLNQDGQIQHNQQQGNFISTENNAPIQLKLIQQGLIL